MKDVLVDVGENEVFAMNRARQFRRVNHFNHRVKSRLQKLMLVPRREQQAMNKTAVLISLQLLNSKRAVSEQ